MSIITELHIDGKRFKVISYQWSFNQPIDTTGRPVAKPQGGIMHLLIETEKDEPFTEWTVNATMMKNAKLIQRSVNLDGKSRIIDLIDVHCIKCEDLFSSTGSKNLNTALTLSPAQIVVNGEKKMEKHWKVTDLDAKNIVPTTRNQETDEEKPKKCTVEFDADNSDVKKGKFGFDKLTDKLLRICDSDEAKLKNEYDPITVEGEEYFPPWVSIRKGQTITLKVKSKYDNKGEYQSVAIEDHPDFTFDPKDLKEASEIKITCNNTNPSTAQVKVIADGKDAGAINFFYPEPKTVDLRWVFVEIGGNDEKTFTSKITHQKLTDYFKESLNPSLIDISIQNQAAAVSDISAKKADLEKGGFIKNDKNAGSYIENNKRGTVMNLGSSPINDPNKANNGINVYFFNLKCIDSKKLSTNGSYPMVGGLSPTGKGDAYLILDDNKRIEEGNISHEVMHALGLLHTFKENMNSDKGKLHTFKLGKTNNYMDYKNSKQSTFKYQWVKLYNSNYSK